MFLRLILLAVLALPVLTASARAEDYATPAWGDLMRTLVRFNALSLSDPAVLDEYTVITECKLYKAFYRDDFKWNQVRQAVLDSVRNNVATFPMNYHYDTQMELDRYDFEAKSYKFTAKSAINGINSLELFAVEGTGCGTADVKLLPRFFHAVLGGPLYLDGLPLAPKDAEALYKQMVADQNTKHIISARFNLRIVYIDPLRKTGVGGAGKENVVRYAQSNVVQERSVRLDARLDSIDFYEDPGMTRLIYEYEPGAQ
jgi:hypothetical protein